MSEEETVEALKKNF